MDLEQAMAEQSVPWQPLESVLSVWLEMIERGKAVALHKDVRAPSPFSRVAQPAGSISMEPFLPPEEPQVDPTSGARRTGIVYTPWVVQPYPDRDLADSLARWNGLVQAVEDRMPAQSIDRITGVSYGLYNLSLIHI